MKNNSENVVTIREWYSVAWSVYGRNKVDILKGDGEHIYMKCDIKDSLYFR